MNKKFKFRRKNASQCLKFCFLLFIMGICSGAFAQNSMRVSGRVVDDKGEPLIGVSVMVKADKTIGAITDTDGKYSLTVPGKNDILQFSYIGYLTQEITVGSKSEINVTLLENLKSLDEVVVVGYGTQKKASLTSAISQISGDDAFKDRGFTNPSVALQGTVPGLYVTRTSTRPGNENISMKIRGDISVNGASSPLVLIDGISGSLDELNAMNPNDIENISVLKDASAAIYGARSASGVLLVSTKRGKKGATKVSYSNLFSKTIEGINPKWSTNSEWIEMWYEAQYQDARANNPNLTTNEDIMKQFNWWVFTASSTSGGIDLETNQIIESKDLLAALWKGREFSVSKGATVKVIRYKPDTYLIDELFGSASWQKHSVNLSGGDDRFNYMASLGYAENQSQLKVTRDGENKYSGRLNADYQANKMLKIESGMSFEKRNITAPYISTSIGYDDLWPWPIKNEQGQWYDSWSGNRNPVGRLTDGGFNKTDYGTSRMNLKLILDLSQFVKGLSISGTGGYKNVQQNTQNFRQNVKFYDWVGNYQNQIQANDELREEASNWQNITLGGFVNYENLFNKVHRVSAMFGATSEEENYKRIYASRRSGSLFQNSGLIDLDAMINGTNNEAAGGQSSWAFLSYLTRLNYAYNNKYLIEFLARRDGTSRLYPDQRWKNFYSVSAGWVLSQESFLANLSWLNFLKLRYNYGRTGSVEGIGNYERFATLTSESAYFGAGTGLAAQPSLRLGAMTSSSRTWETIEKNNFGLDFATLKNRLSGSFEYFSNTNKGMFIPITYPDVLGASAPKTNNGKFQTKGWEFSPDWKDKIGQVTYHIGGFIADASSKVLELENNNNKPDPGKNSNRLIGMPREAIYIFKTNGIFQTQAEADAYYDKYYWINPADHSKGVKSGNVLPAPGVTGAYRLRPGMRIRVDTNGDGAITNDDLVYAGDAAPRMSFGFKAGLEWKGIDINAFFQGVGKQVVLRTGGQAGPMCNGTSGLQQTKGKGQLWSDVAIPHPFTDGNLIEANTTTNYTIASATANVGRYNYWNSDVALQNSTYIRLKSLVVGYTLPQNITKKVGISKTRVYFSGDDLWEWTKIKDGYDPEYGDNTNNMFPFTRLISVGLDVTF